ncbi:MAG: exodeoxyribonuclease III [Clostridiaceae bacterium]|nr:exodeoxyribonuclease III [Clostridiaceae bacterium]
MLKLISWNVNGLRAVLGKGFLEFFDKEKPDILCLQETKLSEGQLDLELEGYYSYYNYAEKKGYSGTAVYTRIKPLDVTFGIGIDEHDHEGRVITLEFENCFLVNVYTPNSQRGLARLPYRMEWEDAFRAYLVSLDSKKPVIVCGDMNVAHQEIDLKNPQSNHNNAGFSDEERAKFSELLEAGFIDSFRYFYPDQEGAYTWWSYMFKAREKNVGWRIDYFCVSKKIEDKIKDALIYSEVMGSDHCPVGLLADEGLFL